MDDLLKEAIADAKAVRETALANAKMALEEAFTPKLKSMLAKKIQSEIEDEDGDEAEVEEQDELSDEDDVVDPASDEEGGPVSEEDEVSDEDDEVEESAELSDEEEAAEEPISTEDEDEDEEPVAEEDEVSDEDDEEAVAEEDELSDEDDEELDLEAILRELEDEDDDAEVSEEYEDEDVEDGAEEVPAAEQPDDSVSENDVSSDIGKADNKVADAAADSSKTGAQGPEGEGSDSEAGKENSEDEVVKEEDEVSDEDDDIDLEEVLKALSEEDEVSDEDDEVEENAVLKAEIKEHRDVVKYLRAKLNEVNLLNAKLLFSNKLFRVFGLSNEQKMKVVETFDRTKNIREIKLVYSTLAESFKGRRPVKESKGSSSKAIASTKPSKKVISEGSDVRSRFKKLANII
tara:strand:- start:283 stop:1494 length:1212 start_codon:yes stop_codon:yes gene_type:complete